MVSYVPETNIKPLTHNKEDPFNKDICNAFGCSNRAEKEVNVNAGRFGIISLNVCSKYIYIFKNENVSHHKSTIVKGYV
jgi:hypothetical protein